MLRTVQYTKSVIAIKRSSNRPGCRHGLLIALSALLCIALSPSSRATCQEGCFTNSNTVLGEDAFLVNTTGSGNTAVGVNALLSNTTGSSNTATGAVALFSNSTGNDNTATGVNALFSNTSGSANTAVGFLALLDNTTGANNTAIGPSALQNNSTGSDNTATGLAVLFSNTTGKSNVALGNNALFANTTGSSNIAIGDSAGSALTTGKNNIDIGNVGLAGESAKIRIGNNAQKNTFIAGISGVTVAGGVGVVIDGNGHLGTATSSARYKEKIQPMDKASEAILSLKPVTFRYKKELDPAAIPQFGLVAEEVAKIDPDLVAKDQEGKPYTVRYEAVNAMLLNEFLKEHRKVEQLTSELAKQKTQLSTLTAHMQRVSDQLALSNATSQAVASNQ